LQLEQERQEKLKEDIKLQVEREMAALFELKFSQLERELQDKEEKMERMQKLIVPVE